MDYTKIAKDILDHVGGTANVSELTHCFTRLRFVLKDQTKANKAVMEHLEGVITVVENAGQFQVVLGNKVEKVFDAMQPLLGDMQEQTMDTAAQGSLLNRLITKFAALFTPIIPAIAGSGMLKGILAIAVMVGTSYGVDVKISQTYIIMNAASDAVFYFMPIILAYSCAKVFKCNVFISMIIGGALCHPALVALMSGKEAVNLFGITITKASYTSSVIPIIIAILIFSYVERYLTKIIPDAIKIIMLPTFSLIIMIPATLMVFGPIGIYIGDAVNWTYYFIMALSPILLGAFIGGMWCVLVIFGAHRAVVPIGINDVATTGRQSLLAFAGAANFSQAGAALGVFLKTKNEQMKAIAGAASITALFGITEPAIYGATLRLKKPMICAVICGAIGGGIMGWGGSYGTAFANQGILTIPVYAEAGTKAFTCYLIGIAIAFFGSAILTYIVGFEDIPNEKPEKKENVIKGIARSGDADIIIASPVEGRVMPLSQVKDNVFSSNAMGKGIAVVPSLGEVVAPADCTVSVLYPTLHAIGLNLDSGAEVLIHIGMDTVNMNGDGFAKFTEMGSKITKGTKIVTFDIAKIEEAGYDPTVVVIISNTENYTEVIGTENKKTALLEDLITVIR
jgi:PTS system beta-glucosides-specific IIC component